MGVSVERVAPYSVRQAGPGLAPGLRLFTIVLLLRREVCRALSYIAEASAPLTNYSLAGSADPVLDPSIIRQGSTYYEFSTDAAGFPSSGHLPIHCSQDKVSWSLCGSMFPDAMPQWVTNNLPGIVGLWAPDISYFNGLYHVCYCGSTLGSNRTAIGLATNTTLDANDPAYKSGGAAYIDSTTGESLLIFHAQNLSMGGTPFEWLKEMEWVNGWPEICN